MTILTFAFHGKELSVLLKALQAHEEVQIVLSTPIPSASQIVKDAKTVHSLLHKDFATAPTSKTRRTKPAYKSNDQYHTADGEFSTRR